VLNPTVPMRQWAATFSVAACILAFLTYRYVFFPRPLPSPSPLPTMVEVQGGVRNPGLVALPDQAATAGEAIRAAGGIIDVGMGAIPEDVLSRRVMPGTLLRVERGESGEARARVEPMSASARLTLGIRLDLNDSSVEELLRVPRMKPEIARAIVERRKQKAWRDLEELSEIHGIGPKTVEKWRAYLSPGAARE
jgi:competence protein ComEA